MGDDNISNKSSNNIGDKTDGVKSQNDARLEKVEYNGSSNFEINIDQTSTSTRMETYARITDRAEDKVKIEGKILAEQGGEKLVVQGYEVSNGTLRINIDTIGPESGFSTQVITTYSYDMVVEGDVDKMGISVNHMDGEEYQLTMTNENVNAFISDQTTDSQKQSSEVKVNTNDDRVSVNGTIVGNTGGQEVIINSVENKDGVTYVDVGLQKPDGFATQVMTGYEYTAVVENHTGSVVIQHSGKKVFDTRK